MILDGKFSNLGRTTEMQLKSLRSQLGIGIDPAYDYTEMIERKKALTRGLTRGRSESPAKTSEALGEQQPSASSRGPLYELEKALHAAVEGDRQENQIEQKQSAGDGFRTPDIVRERRRVHPSYAFIAQSRAERNRIEEKITFHPPPVGSYRPKDELIRPPQRFVDFAMKKETKGRHTIAAEAEIENLKAEGLPYDHILKKAVSVELMEGIPDHPAVHVNVPNLDKGIPRPDIVKLSKLEFHVNSFTAGVLEGDLVTSQLPRKPIWDFGKGRERPGPSERASYFQPGQYKTDGVMDKVRPKACKIGIPFEMQPSRKPISKPVSHGPSLIPDRSLARACPVTQPKLLTGVEHTKQSDRKPISDAVKDYHHTDDPKACQAVRQQEMAYDVCVAEKPLLKRPAAIDNFARSLNRDQAAQGLRSYGQDPVLQRGKHMQKVRSVETLPVDSVYRKQTLTGHHRVLGTDFIRMRGREDELEYTNSPPRKRDFSNASQFTRGIRNGESLVNAAEFSSLTGSMNQLRKARSYAALQPVGERPSNKMAQIEDAPARQGD
jgi:hypothetical protein